MFNLNPKKIDWNKELGTGAFASIYPYQNDQTDQKWVIKKQTAKTFKELLRFFQEIVLGFSFDHFAILPVRGYFIEESSPQIYNIYMKLPRMKKTLKSLIDEHRADNNTPISEETHVKILYNLSCALEYLQNKRIAHRDIKPANILIGSKGEIKLADIGIARFEAEDETLKTIRESTGTLYYMAPELDEGPKKNRDLYKGDIWSLGILMIETCLLRTKIMPQTLPIEQKKEILDVCLTKIEETYGKEFAGIIASLVHLDPNQRKTASEVRKVLESKYLKVLNLKQKDGSEPVYIEENKEAYTPLSHGNIKRHKNSGSNADSFGELMEIEEEKHKSRHLDEPQSSVEQLKEMVKDLQDKWNKWFTSSLGELLTVKANASATDENAFYYIKDFQGKMKEQDTINLPKVLLDFENCKCLTDDTFEQINTLVEENFGSTESLSLNFTNCENLTEESMKPLIKTIKNISALKEVYINLKGCCQISENFKKWAQDELALIQKSSIE